MLLVDAIRFDPSKAQLMLASAILPIAYLVVFILGPKLTGLNVSKPVPARVTS